MKLSYILEMLAAAELSNLHLVDNEQFIIRPEKMPIVIRCINSGLNDIHTRFLLRKNIIDVPIIAGEDTYTITADDFIEILDVKYNEDTLDSPRDYTLLDVNKLKFKRNLGILGILSVEYKAKHRVLTPVDVSLDAEVNLPDSYLNALLYFVASKLYTSPVNKLDGDLNEGAAYMSKFYEEVKMLNHQGIDVKDVESIDNFTSRGFV